MANATISLTPERFAQGMTFDEYLAFVRTPENLAREASLGGKRQDQSERLRAWYDSMPLTDHQAAAIRELAALDGGPANLLVISEEWSSDCRRDVPVLARLAEAGGLQLRIFPRDGQRFSAAPEPDPAESPNADLMAQFLNRKPGGPFQSIPVAAFFDRDFNYIYHYTEYPAVYHKDLIQGSYREPRPGETQAETEARWPGEWLTWQETPYFRVIACAAIDEILLALHRRLVFGSS